MFQYFKIISKNNVLKTKKKSFKIINFQKHFVNINLNSKTTSILEISLFFRYVYSRHQSKCKSTLSIDRSSLDWGKKLTSSKSCLEFARFQRAKYILTKRLNLLAKMKLNFIFGILNQNLI